VKTDCHRHTKPGRGAVMLARAKPKAKPKSALDQVLKLGQEKSSKRGKGKKHHKCEAAVKLGGVLFSGDEDGGESNEDKDDKKNDILDGDIEDQYAHHPHPHRQMHRPTSVHIDHSDCALLRGVGRI
jgi:hypothetical protein